MKTFISNGLMCLLALILGCQTKEGRVPGMEYDNCLGQTEEDVVGRFGKPYQVEVAPAKDFANALAMPIYKKYSPSRLNTKIKEMSYEVDGYQLFFWLENKRQIWRVVGDAKFRIGVVF